MRRDYYFNGECAKMYGVDGAIMLHHFVHWVQYNSLHGLNHEAGKVWTYNSATAFRAFFPFWTAEQVRRVLRNLERDGAIETANFNRMGMDRTKWYTITPAVGAVYGFHLPQFGEPRDAFCETKKSILANHEMHFGKPRNQYQVNNTGDKPVINQVREEVVLPWEEPEFAAAWGSWKAYKAQEHSFRYKTPASELAALHKLQQDSGGRLPVAIQMIQNSMANGYKGLFAPRSTAQPAGAGFNADAVREWAAGGR